jgi:Co/Zn/Cd efflux system component
VYEPPLTPPLPLGKFLRRQVKHVAISMGVILFSLAGGMTGYMYFERLPWLDAFLNAAMLLGGMGPVDMPKTPGGKFFAGSYALYSGLMVLAVAGVLVAPLAHWLLHRLHWDARNDK